jgi:hypothetical protein
MGSAPEVLLEGDNNKVVVVYVKKREGREKGSQ